MECFKGISGWSLSSFIPLLCQQVYLEFWSKTPIAPIIDKLVDQLPCALSWSDAVKPKDRMMFNVRFSEPLLAFTQWRTGPYMPAAMLMLLVQVSISEMTIVQHWNTCQNINKFSLEIISKTIQCNKISGKVLHCQSTTTNLRRGSWPWGANNLRKHQLGKSSALGEWKSVL